MNIRDKLLLFAAILVFFGLIFWSLPNLVDAQESSGVQQQVADREAQIRELEAQIAEYKKQIQSTQGRASTLEGEIGRLNAQINKVQLEIQSLSLSIAKTDDELVTTEDRIVDAGEKIKTHKGALTQNLQEIYEVDQHNLTTVLLQNDQLSDFFNELNDLEIVQTELKTNILAIRDLQLELEAEREHLQEQKGELAQLRSIQASQRTTLASHKNEKDELLDATRGEEAQYQAIVDQKQRDVNALKREISDLLDTGVSYEDATTYGVIVAQRYNMRPGFLLALLTVESRLGENTGTGTFYQDMHGCYLRLAQFYPNKADYYRKRAADEEAAFLTIVNGLGLDPYAVKVSREPTYGCGGAMGPAQFIPTTWLAYADRISQTTGHYPPNPWSIEDSFTAAAIKLSAGGAAQGTREGEIRASKAYISGNPNCTSAICNYYANTIQDKAAIIEQNL